MAMELLFIFALLCVGLPGSDQFGFYRPEDMTVCHMQGFTCYETDNCGSLGNSLPPRYGCLTRERCCRSPPFVQTIFAATAVEVNENVTGGLLVIPISVSPTPTSPWGGKLETSDGTAIHGIDYDGAPSPLSFGFPAGTTNIVMWITILDDYILDPDETFQARLFDLNPPQPDIVITITIRDPEDVCDLSCANGGACENGPGGNTCTCLAGFHGSTCEIDACAPSNDQCDQGTCVRETVDPWFSCDCNPGYTEPLCNVLNWTCSYTETDNKKGDAGKEPKIDVVDLADCKTRCTADTRCIAAEYRDDRKECNFYFDTLPTLNNDNNFVFIEKSCYEVCDPACVNGVCQSDGAGGKTCVCQAGFHGSTCENDACAPSNDQCDQGTCVRETADPWFSCDCNLGWSEQLCNVLNYTCSSYTETDNKKGEAGKEPKIDVADLADCKTRCTADTRCIAAEYRDDRQECNFYYDTLPTLKNDNKFVFIEKFCELVCDPPCVNGVCQSDGAGGRECVCDEMYSGPQCDVLNWTCSYTDTDNKKGEAGKEPKIDVQDLAECKTLCTADTRCIAAEYRDDRQECNFYYDTMPTLKNDNKFVFIEKYCHVVCDPPCVNGVCQSDGAGGRECVCDAMYMGPQCDALNWTCSYTDTDNKKGEAGKEPKIDVQDLAECKTLCTADSRCLAAEYRDDRQECNFYYDTLPTLKNDNKFVFIEKYCHVACDPPCVNGACQSDGAGGSECVCDAMYSGPQCDVLNWTCSYTDTDNKKGEAGKEPKIDVVDLADCKTRCTADTRCIAAEYRDDRQECNFYYDTLPTLKNDNKFVFIEKYCHVACDPPCVNGVCQSDGAGGRECVCDAMYSGPQCDVLNWTCSYTDTDNKKGEAGKEPKIDVQDLAECKTLCTADTRCLAAEYRDDRQECNFYYDTLPTLKNDNKFVFVEKSCFEVCDPACVNGGTCETNGTGMKSCVCTAGFTGPTCSDVVP